MDKGLVNGLIFLKLKKAFDCVDHNILTEKLVKFGCIGNTLNWFKSYLTNRCVKLTKRHQNVEQFLA